MKKHLRMTTAAVAALGLSLVGCETEDGTADDPAEETDIIGDPETDEEG